MRCRIDSLLCLVFAFAFAASSLTLTAHGQASSTKKPGTETDAENAYNAAVKQGPTALYGFLESFPKGADLHVHLTGAVYAETFIRDAGQDGLCVDTAALSFAKPPCAGNKISATDLSGNILPANQAIYDKLIDAFSMRSFVPSPEWSGHDQFFATFDRFGGLNKTHYAEWVDEVAQPAAGQNNQYLELMKTPPFSHATEIAHQVGWNAQLAQADPQAFAQFRQALLARDCATRSQRTSTTRNRPRPGASKSNIVARRRPPRHARSRCGTFTRSCATMRPNRCLPRRFSALKRCRQA